jgi:tetratricopeptide (TPR) repeat protein
MGSLDALSIGRLAGALVGGPVDDGVIQGLTDRVAGNPLFLEESVRLLLESGALVRDDGMWRLREGDSLDVMPDSLVALLAARIDALPQDERETLRSLAVAGDDADRGVLRALGISSPEPALRGLDRRGLLTARKRGRRGGPIVRHPLVRDVAERGLSHAERSQGHMTVATRLAAMGDAAGAVRHALTAWDLAPSHLRAPRAEEAAAVALRWGDGAFGSSRREAEIAYRFASEVALDAPSGLRDRLRASALTGRAEALIDLARHDEAQVDAEEALRGALRTGDEALVAAAQLALGRVASDRGDIEAATTLLRDALSRFERLDDLSGQAWSWHRHARTWREARLRGAIRRAL